MKNTCFDCRRNVSHVPKEVVPELFACIYFRRHGRTYFANRQFFDWRCKNVEWLSH